MGRGGTTEVCVLGLEGRGKEPSGGSVAEAAGSGGGALCVWAASWSAARVTVRSMARPSAEAVRCDDKEAAVAEVPIRNGKTRDTGMIESDRREWIEQEMEQLRPEASHARTTSPEGKWVEWERSSDDPTTAPQRSWNQKKGIQGMKG